jgi:hypothetical protein
VRVAPARGVTALLLAILVVGACGDSGSARPSMPPGPTPVGPPETLPPPQTSEPASVSASSGTTPAPPVTSPSSDAVVRDDTLLDLLPSAIDGAPVIVEEQSFAEAATDPAFADNVQRAAFAVVTTPTDLASGVVAKLRAGVFDAAFFADWRDTYNEGACAQAGGVATNAETQLEGRTVYITTCAGGMLVYHTHLGEQDAIVSLFSLGEARFGERLMRGLRP